MSEILRKLFSCLSISHHWPNISTSDPDPSSGSKKLSLKKDHFLLNDPVKGSLFSGSFERKFLEQLTAYDLVWGFVNESWKCTSLHVHYVPLYLWRKSRNIGSKHFEPEPGSKSRRFYFRIKVEILGHCLYFKINFEMLISFSYQCGALIH